MSILYTGKLQFIFSVPQLSIFDPELLCEKKKSTPKDGLILQRTSALTFSSRDAWIFSI